jgi:HD-GYP domain-containing protein (c-di-GMP phosphodiesterase class II)
MTSHPLSVTRSAGTAKRTFQGKGIWLQSSIAEIAVNAIYSASLHEQTQNKVRQLDSLRTIDQTINSRLDLRVMLRVIVGEAPKLIPMDALAILIYYQRTLKLMYASGSGFKTKIIEESIVRISSGLAGKAALERRLISIANLQDSLDVLTRKALVEKEGFIAYYAVPLIVKGETQGVLEVFHRTPFTLDEELQDILEALTTQVAIAIDNSAMFTGIQRSNFNLTQAYDETIEGWAKALELRDKETEGHTRRVVDKALVLARMAGIKGEEIVFFTRGALLHDIGKMAIPDAVLNKPGALSDEEWVLMRAHPKIAHDLLSSIKYLRPALDIPYCHHEKWDGSGYPRGLKGEEIPLAARVFAVIDVYDALTSDRSYRKAWGKEKLLAFIKDQSGHHFDPRAEDLFIKSNSS